MSLQTFINGEALSSIRTKINAMFTELYSSYTLKSANNLSDVSSAATARSNLWLAIWSNVQAYSANTTVLWNTVTGSWSIVLATSPTLITPVLWVASASSITIGWASGNTLVVDTSTLIVDATNHRVWMLTTAPTHTLTQWSTGTGYAHYNTPDQVTNYERLRMQWASNRFDITAGNGWTGVARNIRIGVNATGWDTNGGTAYIDYGGTTMVYSCRSSPSNTIWHSITIGSGWSTLSSGVYTHLSVTPILNQTSTAAYTWILVNATETWIWSWAKNLMLLQVWWTTKAGIDNNWWLLNTRVISANAATPVNITAPDSNKVYTNEWASAKIVFNLPTAVAGYTYTFIVQDTDWVDITAAAWDTIRRNTNVTAAAWTVTSTAIGSILVLVAINATEWIAITEIWTWA